MFNTIYISGKITGIEEEALINFNKAEYELTSLGYNVVNPMKLPHNHDKEWSSYMRECLVHLMDCDYIFILDGYEQSKGARLELYIAQELGLKILTNFTI